MQNLGLFEVPLYVWYQRYRRLQRKWGLLGPDELEQPRAALILQPSWRRLPVISQQGQYEHDAIGLQQMRNP